MNTTSTADCRQCAHYRAPAPLSGILGRLIRSTHREVSEALDEIAARDEAFCEKETEAIVHEAHTTVVDWAQRPRTVPYCGLLESDDRWLMYQVVNRDGQCRDFTPRTAANVRDCARCAHRHPAPGDARDRMVLAVIAQHLAQGGARHPQLEAEYSRRQQHIGSQKAREVREAYRNHGEIYEPPDYLDWCDRHDNGRIEVPQCVNQQHDCASFVPDAPDIRRCGLSRNS